MRKKSRFYIFVLLMTLFLLNGCNSFHREEGDQEYAGEELEEQESSLLTDLFGREV